MLKIYKIIKRRLLTLIALMKIEDYKTRPFVNGLTIFNKYTKLGLNCNFNGFRVYGNGQVIIGDNFHSGKGCYIVTQHHNYEGTKIPYDDTYTFKRVEIEDNVWFGMNVSVLSNCNIGEGAIIQAGAVVVSDIPKFAIAGGNPAKVFRYRDKEHYLELKDKKQFH